MRNLVRTNSGIIITTSKNITFELWVGSHGYLHGGKNVITNAFDYVVILTYKYP